MRALLFLIAVGIAQAQTGGLGGTVIDSVTQQPIRKASVTLSLIANQGGSGPQNHMAITDAGGGFTFDSLPAGQYIVTVQHSDYPQSRAPLRKKVEITAGDTAGPLTLELTPGASIGGRVLDEDGDPLIGCNVQVHPANHPEQGMQYGTSPPNENGEYRLFGLPAGKYFFSAQCLNPPFQPRPFSAGPDPPPSLGYPVEYYPLTSEAKSAQPVELAASAEKSGVDFRMRPMPVTQVRGTISSGGADFRVQPINLQLVPADATSQNAQQMSRAGARVSNDGKFEFPQVFPGSYYLIGFSNTVPGDRIGAVQRIEVKDQPVETVVELTHGFEIHGKVDFENSDSTNPVVPKTFFVQLIPQNLPIGGRGGEQLQDDGTFIETSLFPGRYRLFINGPSAFIKSAWLGSTEITDREFDISAAAELHVVMSTNMAILSGTAPAGQSVMVSRVEDGPQRGFTGATADASGHFTIRNLAPGTYRVVLTNPGEPAPDEGGQEVTVHEGETVTVDVKPDSQ